MSFTVRPGTLDAAALDMMTLNDAVSAARSQVSMWVQSSIGGGTWFYDAGPEINDLRDDLLDTYSYDQVGGLFTAAAATLGQMAEGYRTVDLNAAAELDEHVKKLDAPSLGIPAGVFTGGAKGQVADFEYLGNPEDEFEAWDDFIGISRAITKITSFEFLGTPLEKLGLPNPVKEVLDWFDGDWEGLGRALGAVDQLQGHWYDVASGLDTVATYLGKDWTGNAADATILWMEDLASACRDHAQSLSKFGTRVKTEALAMKSALDLIEELLNDIAGMIPSMDGNLLDKLGSVMGSAGKALLKLFDVVDKALMAIEAAISVAYSLLTVFAQLSMGDGEFDSVPRPAQYDVNG